jgi:hypothetical protein
MRGLMGGAPHCGNGGQRSREIRRIIHQAERKFGANAGHFLQERLREKAGSLCDRKRDVRPRDGVEQVLQIAEGFRAEARVEVLTESGNHRMRVKRAAEARQLGV